MTLMIWAFFKETRKGWVIKKDKSKNDESELDTGQPAPDDELTEETESAKV